MKSIYIIWGLLPAWLALLPPALGQDDAQGKTVDAVQQPVDESSGCEEGGCSLRKQNKVPLGARISDALTRQDREAAADILEHEKVLLNDEMNLLFLVSRNREAADIAFTLLERSDQDPSLYEQAVPILMANSRHAGLQSTYQMFESYSGLNTQLNSYGHRLGGITLDVSVYQETRSNLDTALLNSAPDERGAEIALHHGVENVLKLQHSQGLSTQYGAGFSHRRKIGARLQLELLAAANQAATENAAMRIMGRADQFGFESTYNIDGDKQWLVEWKQSRYRSIDGEELGSGRLMSTTLSQALSGIRPALHARLTGIVNEFQNADTVISGRAAGLVPAGDASTPAFFMPQNVTETALYLSLGDPTTETTPAHGLESYIEVGGFDNLTTGPGWRYSAGLAGKVIGADRLHIFVRYDQSSNGQAYFSREAGLAYLVHY